MACVPADDDYLVLAFPGVVQFAKEKWLITVLASTPGDYTVTMAGSGYLMTAVLADTVSTIRNGLLFKLGAQVQAAVSPMGVAGISVTEVGLGGLDISVAGPAVDTIQATLVSGGDINEANRLFWLARALCGLPPCCLFTCEGDYTLMHAALAAHWIYTLGLGNVNGAGNAAGDWQSMRLGPASLSKGLNAWSANPADADLAKTAPGQLYLQLRTRYVAPFLCA